MDEQLEAKRAYFDEQRRQHQRFDLAEQMAYVMLCDGYHRAANIRGSLAEIGVFLGDYLMGLGVCARPDEPLLAIDLFNNQSANVDGSGEHDKGISYFKQLHKKHVRSGSQLTCIQADSLTLTSRDLLQHTGGKRIRLASIDGGHEHYHVTSDLAVIEGALTYGGVVIIDDYSNAGWPGVCEGVARYFLLSPHRKLAPFLCSWNKLLLTTESHHAALLDHFVEHCKKHGHDVKIKKLYGWDILHSQGFSNTWSDPAV